MKGVIIMKKIISLLLAIVMLVSLAIPAFALHFYNYDEKTGVYSEEFSFGSSMKSDTYSGTNVSLVSNKHSGYDVYVGNCGSVRIYVNGDKNFYITRVEARVSSYPSAYADVEVNPGTKCDVGNVTYDSIVCIDDINSNMFELSGGIDAVGFDKIIIYYKEGTPPTASTISEGNIWIAVAIGAVAVVAIAAVVIAKKKKKA